MGALRGAVVGSLGLVTLYNLSTAPTAGVTTLAGLPGRFAHWLISSDTPLVPDRAGDAGGLSGSVAPGDPLAGGSSSTSSSSGLSGSVAPGDPLAKVPN